MWRGYPDALGVYIAINCEIWAQRTNKAGEPFSNNLMAQHMQTYRFGRNVQGDMVHKLQNGGVTKNVTLAAPSTSAAVINQVEQKESSEAEEKQDLDEQKESIDEDQVADIVAQVTASPAVAAVAAATTSNLSVPTASSSSSSSSAIPVTHSAATLSPPPQRAGTYVDNIRIPWWFHNRQIHDSDAAILYKKDPTYYKQFRKYAKQYKEYVWPRDIEPVHPEQKEELDELQVILDADAAVKEEKERQKLADREAKKAQNAKLRKEKKRKSDASEPVGEEESKDAESSPTAVASAKIAVSDDTTLDTLAADAEASSEQKSSTKRRISRRGSLDTMTSTLTLASTPSSPYRTTRTSAKAASEAIPAAAAPTNKRRKITMDQPAAASADAKSTDAMEL